MEYATKFDADWALILGETEARNNQIIIKNMQTSKQEKLPLDNFLPGLIERIGKENILHYREE